MFSEASVILSILLCRQPPEADTSLVLISSSSHCIVRYASYWNAFYLWVKSRHTKSAAEFLHLFVCSKGVCQFLSHVLSGVVWCHFLSGPMFFWGICLQSGEVLISSNQQPKRAVRILLECILVFRKVIKVFTKSPKSMVSAALSLSVPKSITPQSICKTKISKLYLR